ncbi:MAG: AsmA family protein [Desulfobacter sp.]|nr:MAG: AsmA family protein [Desulfobacter sp.]
MKKVIKWGAIAAGVCLVLIVGAVVLVPMFVDVQKYKPEIEALVTEQTGRSFSMGDDIKLSVFPWVGVSLSDLKLGNAAGFAGDEMVSVKGFEVRLKVMPLFSRQVQVDKFIMDSPRIILAKNKAGKGNWEMGPAGKKKAAPKAETPAAKGGGALPIDSLMVGRFSIINGLLSYVDQKTGMSKEVSDLNLELADISLDKPVKIDLSAKLDGKPLSLSGQAGPVGKEPGKSDMGIDLRIKALNELELALKGQLIAPATAQKIDLTLNVSPFSPRRLFEALGQPFPVETKDPGALDKVFFRAAVKGSAAAVSLTGGELGLDDSLMKFSAQVGAFSKPDIKFDLALDKIDLDRYLPPAKEGQGQPAGAGAKTGAKTGSGTQAKPDYAPLRRMVLDGKATVGSLKAANLKMENVLVKITGKGGVFNLDPFSMDFYQGKAGAKARLDVRKNTPVTSLNITSQGVQAGPVIKDAAQKEIIEGALDADIGLTMTGDTPDQIKKTLGGKGELTFTDGAIVGIDIAGTIRNAKSLGLGEKSTEKPKTDFAELKIPYTASQGLVTIPGASLVSPLLRLVTTGKTHLPQESLDFRIEPKVVATLKGQGDTQQRRGLLIPLVVTGTYAHPKIRPDLKAVVGKELTSPEGIMGVLGGKSGEGETATEGAPAQETKPEDKVKSLLKGFIQ